jgi:hypothetical protein
MPRTAATPGGEIRWLGQGERHPFEVPDAQGRSERVDGWRRRTEDAQGATPLPLELHGNAASKLVLCAGEGHRSTSQCQPGHRVDVVQRVCTGSHAGHVAAPSALSMPAR